MGDPAMPDVADSPLVGPVEYDPETDTYRSTYDWTSPVALTTAIVEVVAEVEDADPREVSRLVEGIDPEALDALFAPGPFARSRREGRVSFVFGGRRVTVHGTGVIEVQA